MPSLAEQAIYASQYESMKKMLVTLAIHLTPKTKFMEVPFGTRDYHFMRQHDYPRGFEARPLEDTVELVPLFGMMVGYYEFGDVVVYWVMT